MSIRKTKIVFLLLACAASSSFAADGELKSLEQKFSYTLGYTFAQQMKGQVVAVDKDAMIAAIEDSFAGKDPRLSKEDMSGSLEQVKAKIAEIGVAQAQKNLDDGKKFLSENKKRKGVVELDNGVQYLELKKGEGDSPKPDSDVTVEYVGTHIGGAVFDSSKRHGGPATFNLARVIPGFSSAISKMKKGAKWQIFIPADQAYGEAGSPPTIEPNEVLVFEIELISFGDSKPEEKPTK